MPQVVFEDIDITDFKSIAHLKFKLNRGPGVHFVCGRNKLYPRLQSNGVGKSSIFSALCWVLFGRTEDGLRGPDLVPWRNGGHPRVVLRATVDGAEHRIGRGHNPNSLVLDGDDVSQETIENLIGYDFYTFVNTQLLGQDQKLFFDKPPADKLRLFADVLNLEPWDRRSDKAKRASEALQREVDTEQATLEVLTRQHQEAKQQYETSKSEADEWQRGLEQRLAQLDKDLADAKKRLEPLQEKYDRARLAYDGAEMEIEPLRRGIAQLNEYLRIEARELTRLELAAETARQLRDGTCPTCGQRVTRKHKHDPGPLKLAKQKDRDLREQLQRLTESLAQFLQRSQAARAIIDQVQPAVAELGAKVRLTSDRRNVEAEAGNPLRQQLADLRRRRDRLKADIDQRSEGLARKRSRLSRTETWVKGFKDIKLNIIEEVLDDLQLTANALLEQVGLIGWELVFDVERETQRGNIVRGLNVLIRSPENADPVKWECWSGGEGQRLRLLGALALAEVLLNRAGVEPGLEILDEPTQGLSPQGVRDLVDTLAERGSLLGRTILLVDQNLVPSDKFQTQVVIERSRDGTRALRMG